MKKLVTELCQDPYTVAELLEIATEVAELDRPSAVISYDHKLWMVKHAARRILQRIARGEGGN